MFQGLGWETSIATGVEYTFLPAVLDRRGLRMPTSGARGGVRSVSVYSFRQQRVPGLGLLRMLVATFAEPCSGKRPASRCEQQSPGPQKAGIPVLLSPQDQGLRGFGFMGSRLLQGF